jgi:hypothetical protein
LNDEPKNWWTWRESNPHFDVANVAYSHYTTRPILVDTARIELAFTDCQPVVLPLNYAPRVGAASGMCALLSTLPMWCFAI